MFSFDNYNNTTGGAFKFYHQHEQQPENPNLAPLGSNSRFQSNMNLASTTPAAPPPVTPVRASWAHSFLLNANSHSSNRNNGDSAMDTGNNTSSSQQQTEQRNQSSFFDQLLRESAEIVQGKACPTALEEQQKSATKPRRRICPTFVGPVFGETGSSAGPGILRRTFVYSDSYQVDVDVDCEGDVVMVEGGYRIIDGRLICM